VGWCWLGFLPAMITVIDSDFTPFLFGTHLDNTKARVMAADTSKGMLMIAASLRANLKSCMISYL